MLHRTDQNMEAMRCYFVAVDDETLRWKDAAGARMLLANFTSLKVTAARHLRASVGGGAGADCMLALAVVGCDDSDRLASCSSSGPSP